MTIQKPVIFNPKTLSLFSNLANIWAWLNLAAAVVYMLVQFFTLQSQIEQMQGFSFNTLLFNSNKMWWDWTNITSEVVLRYLTSILVQTIVLAGNFFLFKSISIALNVLLEIGLTMTPDEEGEEAENE